jgi:hypothetical protein
MRAATLMPIGGVAVISKGRPVKAAIAIPSTAGFLLHCVSFEANLAFAHPIRKPHNEISSNNLIDEDISVWFLRRIIQDSPK